MNCGCESYCKSCMNEGGGLTSNAIQYCAVHKNAGELLSALKALGTGPEDYCWCRHVKKKKLKHTGECDQARKAVAAALPGFPANP